MDKLELHEIKEIFREFGLRQCVDECSAFSEKADLYYRQIDDGLYLVFNHYCKHCAIRLQGFDCWQCRFKKESEIGKVRPSEVSQIQLTTSSDDVRRILHQYFTK